MTRSGSPPKSEGVSPPSTSGATKPPISRKTRNIEGVLRILALLLDWYQVTTKRKRNWKPRQRENRSLRNSVLLVSPKPPGTLDRRVFWNTRPTRSKDNDKVEKPITTHNLAIPGGIAFFLPAFPALPPLPPLPPLPLLAGARPPSSSSSLSSLLELSPRLSMVPKAAASNRTPGNAAARSAGTA